MATIAAERLQSYEELRRLAEDGPLTVQDDGFDRLVVMSADEYARLRRVSRVTVTNELEPELMAALMAAEPAEDCPDYDPWEEEPHLRPQDA